MDSPQVRIAIVGGGPAGLTLGLLLHNRGIPFTIFELRPRPTDEELAKPSGSLDLHDDSGLAAIRECNLYDEFVLHIDDCTEAQKVSNKNGEIIFQDDGEYSNRPEISRHKLIKLLLSRLPSSTIKWNRKLHSVRSRDASGIGEMELDFGEHGMETFDLVIGADGAWSKVRNFLTDVRPQYAGIQAVTVNVRNIAKRYPHLADFIGQGTFTSLGNRHGICTQRSVDDSARIYIFISADDEQFSITKGLSYKTAAKAKDDFFADQTLFRSWGAKIKELVAVACDDESANNPGAKLDIKPLYHLPVGHRWQHQRNVTVIGDAAHLMCPFAGEGVNLAMRDSLFLSHAIAKAFQIGGADSDAVRNALDLLIGAFEINMAAAAREEAEGTLENREMMFGGDDCATDLANFFKSIGPPHGEHYILAA